MPTVPASLTALPQAAPADLFAITVTRTQVTGTAGEFQAALAEFTGEAEQLPETTGIPDADLTLEVIDETEEVFVADATTTGLLGLVTQFAFLNPPVNAAVAEANGTAAQVQAALTEPTSLVVRTRADQQLLESTGGPTRNGTTPPAIQPDVANALTPDDALATPLTSTTTPAEDQLELSAPAIPTVPTGPGEIAARAAHRVAVRGGLQNIPPPAPIIPDLLPGILVPADLSAAEPVVNATTPIVAASGLPATDLGDRPAMAGEKFAAIASAGAMIASNSTQPPSRMFANVIEEANAALAPQIAPTTARVATATTAPVAPLVAMPLASVNPPFVPTTAVASANAPVVPATAVATAQVSPAVSTTPLTPTAVVAPNAAFEVPLLPTNVTAAPAPVLGSPTNVLEEPRLSDMPAGNTSVISNFLAAPAFGTIATPAPNMPAPFAPVTVPAAQLAEGVAETIVKTASVMERPGAVEFQMRVDPPELGSLHIRLIASGDEMRGHVVVADDAVRRILESQLPELRQRLEAAGVNVQQFNIATDANTGGNRNPYRELMPEYAPRVANTQTPAAAPRARIGRMETGSLDVTV